jgi:hypothetical protein
LNPHYPNVALRARHRCEYCQAPEAIFNFPFEVEHIIPYSCGGLETGENRALSCRSCNLRKAAHLNGVDPVTQESVRLFHPRKDPWNRHFGIDLESGEIIGLTSVGRATLARLKINSPLQIQARRQWMRLGLFPPEAL